MHSLFITARSAGVTRRRAVLADRLHHFPVPALLPLHVDRDHGMRGRHQQQEVKKQAQNQADYQQHQVEDRASEIAIGDLPLLHQPGDQLLHVGLVELNWLCFLEHEQRPRIASQLDADVEKLRRAKKGAKADARKHKETALRRARQYQKLVKTDKVLDVLRQGRNPFGVPVNVGEVESALKDLSTNLRRSV